MSLTDSVTQQVDKRTYLLLLGQAIQFCKALSKARNTSFTLAVTVSAWDADMSLSCTILGQENLPSAAWLGCNCKALSKARNTSFSPCSHTHSVSLGCWHVTHWLSHTISRQENLPSAAWSGCNCKALSKARCRGKSPLLSAWDASTPCANM